MRAKYIRKSCYFLLFSASLLLCGCRGGGIHLFGKKPTWCKMRNEFGGFSSKAYKCVNGSFEPIDDEFRCVNGSCNLVSANGCPWIDVDPNTVIRDKKATHYKAGMYHVESYWNGNKTVKRVKTTPVCCDANNNVVICGAPVTFTEDDDGNTDVTTGTGTPVSTNIGKHSSNPAGDPRLSTPTSCPIDNNYRIEEASCVTATNTNEFAKFLDCSGDLYIDSRDRSENYRQIRISFLVADARQDYRLMVLKNYTTASSISVNDPRILFDTPKLKFEGVNCEIRNVNVSGVASGITSATIITSQLTHGETIAVALFKKNADNTTFSPVGKFCTFNIKTQYSVTYNSGNLQGQTTTYPFTERKINLLIFRNAVTTFNTDITSSQYSFNNLDFKYYLDNIWSSRIHANTGIEYQSLPDHLVDGNGNAVLWMGDMPAGKDFKLVGNNPIHTTILPEELRVMLEKWFSRLQRYNTLLGGNAEGDARVLTNGVIDFNKAKFGNLDRFLRARWYSNKLGLIVINSFSIRDVDGTVSTSLTTDLNAYLTRFRNTPTFNEFAPDGVTGTGGGGNPYFPISVVYQNQAEQYFGGDANLMSGRVFSAMLHELAHGWYFRGSTEPRHYNGRNTTTFLEYYNGHVKFNDFHDVSTCQDYFCLLKPQQGGNGPFADNLVRIFQIGKMDRMRFSEGVTERMRNIFSATY